MAEIDVASYFKNQRQQRDAIIQFESMRAAEFAKIQAKINADNLKTQEEKNRLIKQEKEAFNEVTEQQRQHLIQLLEENRYRNSSVHEMRNIKQAQLESLDATIAQKEALKDTITDESQVLNLESQINDLKANRASLDNEILNFNKAITAAEFENVSLAQKMSFIEDKTQKSFEKYKQAKIDLAAKVKAGVLSQDEADEQLKQQTAVIYGNVTGNEKIDDFISKQASQNSKILKFLKGLNDTLTTINSNMDQYIDRAMNIITNYMGKIDSRLQGTDNSFEKINSIIKKEFTGNAYVTQSRMIENIAKLTEQGIAYNVEERALLMSVSDKIVETFDALEPALTRLTRIQQADMTEPFMGVEARLLKDFNSLFSDSSYLSDMYDTISGAIIDASSQMTLDQSTAFNYMVQKWLGSLYSLGMSSSGVTQIAQGINYLATGDVTGLASNSQLQTLFALSAKNAGLNYAEMLTGGLDAKTVNTLMKSMVEYLQDIVANTSNQVTKSAWGNITNFTLSDLKAIQNLTSADISQIYNKTMNYDSALNELNNQLTNLNSRYSQAELISNILENLTYTTGMGIAESPIKYAAWKGAEIFRDYFKSPGLANTLANIIQSSLSITEIIKSIINTDLISDVWNTYFNKTTDLSTAIDWDMYTQRGQILSQLQPNSVATGISQSGQVTTANMNYSENNASYIDSNLNYANTDMNSVATNMSSPIYSNTPIYTLENGATNTSMSATSVMNSDVGIIRDVSDVYNRLFEDQSTPLNIKIDYFEQTALEQLEKYLRGKEIQAMYDTMTLGSVPVHESDTTATYRTITETLNETQR